MSKAGRRDTARLAQLDALYARLPHLNCQGRCAIACGAIPMTTAEAERLRKVTHVAPRTQPDRDHPTAGACIYLQNDRCTAYRQRPLICRAWGVVMILSCPHGCAPERWLDPKEFLDIAQAVERLGGPLVTTTPTGLTPTNDSFFRITQGLTGAEVERRAVMVHGLRALHGGRILAVTGEGTEPNYVSLDKKKAPDDDR
jgi:hypothetical protein